MQQAHQENDKAKHLLADKDPPAHADSPVVLGTQQSGKARGSRLPARPPALFLPVHPAAQARTPSAPQSLLQHPSPAVSVSALWPSTRVFTFTPARTSPSQSPGSSHSKASITACHSGLTPRGCGHLASDARCGRAARPCPFLETLGTPPTGQRGLHLFKV